MDSKIKIGIALFSISAFLYAMKHVTAAIISINLNTHQANYYEGAYRIVGFGIDFWTGLSCLVGILFFITGVWTAYVKPILKERKNRMQPEDIQ